MINENERKKEMLAKVKQFTLLMEEISEPLHGHLNTGKKNGRLN